MDKEEDLLGVQEALNLTNLLDNALKVFDTLPLEQKMPSSLSMKERKRILLLPNYIGPN
jgi:hypothetical protein